MTALGMPAGSEPAQRGQDMAGDVAHQRMLQVVLQTAVCLVAFISGCLLPLTAPRAAVADPVAGIWAEGECSTSSRVRIINALGLLDIIPVGNEMSLQILVFEHDATGSTTINSRRRVTSPNIQYVFDHEFLVENSRLEVTFSQCNEVPPGILWTFAEAIAAFDFVGQLTEVCDQRDGPRCLEATFQFIDVSGDGKLSPAEVARVFRMIGFFVGYFSHSEAIVPAKNLLGSTALAGLLGPFFAKTMIEGLDYDADGSVALSELMQDRGNAAGLFAAAQAMEPTAAQAALKGAFATLSQLLRFLPL